MAEPEPPPDDEPPAPPPGGGAVMIGPVLGVMLGFVVFRLLPEGTSVWVGLVIALLVIAVTTYATIEITRRRARR